jgi:DNA repair protein RecN (Recombination protein N)
VVGPNADSGGTGGGRTVSVVVAVEGDDRVAELARMLAGRDTGTAREHAAELLRDATAGKVVVDPARGKTGGVAPTRGRGSVADPAKTGPKRRTVHS